MTIWKEITLGDLISIQRGHDLPNTTRKNGDIPVIGSSGLTGYHNEAKMKGPGVTIGRSGGSMGVVSYVENDYWPLNTVLYVKDFKNNDVQFVYYFLKSIDFTSFNSGSAQPSLNRNYIYPMKIRIPDIKTQKKIGNFLNSIDRKIQLNKRMNKTLEEITKLLYQYWFVDYVPFKDTSVIDSAIGPIPHNWELKRVKDVIDLKLGGTPSRSKAEYWNGDIPWVNSGKINEFRITEPTEYITKLGLEKSATKMLPKGTTVIAITGATLGQISRIELEVCANQSVIGLVENELFSSERIYLWLHTVLDKLLKQQTGGAQQHINKGNIEELEILLPPERVRRDFQDLIQPHFKIIASNCFENGHLKVIRDYLLPRLISGELEIAEAEKQVEEVL